MFAEGIGSSSSCGGGSSDDIAAVLKLSGVRDGIVLTANSGAERAQILASVLGNGVASNITVAESSQAPTTFSSKVVAAGTSFGQGHENKPVLAFRSEPTSPKPWVPDPSYYSRNSEEVPIEERNFNFAGAREPAINSPPSRTIGTGKKRRLDLNDGPPPTKRMR